MKPFLIILSGLVLSLVLLYVTTFTIHLFIAGIQTGLLIAYVINQVERKINYEQETKDH